MLTLTATVIPTLTAIPTPTVTPIQTATRTLTPTVDWPHESPDSWYHLN